MKKYVRWAIGFPLLIWAIYILYAEGITLDAAMKSSGLILIAYFVSCFLC